MTPAALLESVIERARRALPTGISDVELRQWAIRQRPRLLLDLGPRLPNHDRIVTLNLGLGRDSLTMLCLLAEGRLQADGRLLALDEVDAVVFADPGAEWSSTYALLPRVRALCDRHGLRLLVLAKPEEAEGRRYLDALPPPGASDRRAALSMRPWRAQTPATIEDKANTGWYHLRPTIIDDYESRATIASRAKKDCTINHKIEPIRKVVEDLSVERFGLDNVAWGAAVRAGERRPHLALIGIAADEADRALVSHPLRGGKGPWYVTEAYPLLEAGLSKGHEAAVLEACGFADAHKSGCVMCPFQTASWYWALRESDPIRWKRVVAYEAKALAANPRMFLLEKRPISEVVEAWRARHPCDTVSQVLAKHYACNRLAA